MKRAPTPPPPEHDPPRRPGWSADELLPPPLPQSAQVGNGPPPSYVAMPGSRPMPSIGSFWEDVDVGGGLQQQQQQQWPGNGPQMMDLEPPPLPPPEGPPPLRPAYSVPISAGSGEQRRPLPPLSSSSPGAPAHSPAAIAEIERMEARRRVEVEEAARLRMLTPQSLARSLMDQNGAGAPASAVARQYSPLLRNPLTMSARDVVICEGLLKKQGNTRSSQWRRRWCVLHPARFDYFKPTQREHPQNRIMMQDVLSVTVDSETYGVNCFQLVTSDRTFAFQAKDSVDLRRWLANLQSVVMATSRVDSPSHLAPPPSQLESDARAMLREEEELPGETATTLAVGTIASSKYLHVAVRDVFAPRKRIVVNEGRANEEQCTVVDVRPADRGAVADISGILTLEQPLALDHGEGERVELMRASAAAPASSSIVYNQILNQSLPQPQPFAQQPQQPQLATATATATAAAAAAAAVPLSSTGMMITPGAICLTPVKVVGSSRSAATTSRSTLAMNPSVPTAGVTSVSDRMGRAAKSERRQQRITDRQLGAHVVPKGSNVVSNQKGLVSARKVQQYIRWIDSLRIWRKIKSLAVEFKTGLLLCRLMERLAPNQIIRGLNRKPVSRTSALSNIEKGLFVVYKGQVSHPNVPTAEQIFRGEPSKVASLVREIFEAFVMKRVRAQAVSTVKWLAMTIEQYDAYFPPLALEAWHLASAKSSTKVDSGEAAQFGGEVQFAPGSQIERLSPLLSALWSRLRSGTLLACVCHYYCGNTIDGVIPPIDLTTFFLDPLVLTGVNSENDIATAATKQNVRLLFRHMHALGIPLIWDVESFVSLPDDDFFLLQLHYIRRFFRTFEPALAVIADDVEVQPGDAVLVRTLTGPDRDRVVLRVDGVLFRPSNSAIEALAELEDEEALEMETGFGLGGGSRSGLEYDEWGGHRSVGAGELARLKDGDGGATPTLSGRRSNRSGRRSNHRSAIGGQRSTRGRKASRRRAASLRAVARLCQKLRASAFSHDGQHVNVLFDRMDTKHLGVLDFTTFRIGCRRVARVPESAVTDNDIRAIFRGICDSDGLLAFGGLADFLKRNEPERTRDANASATRPAYNESWADAEARELAEESALDKVQREREQIEQQYADSARNALDSVSSTRVWGGGLLQQAVSRSPAVSSLAASGAPEVHVNRHGSISITSPMRGGSSSGIVYASAQGDIASAQRGGGAPRMQLGSTKSAMMTTASASPFSSHRGAAAGAGGWAPQPASQWQPLTEEAQAQRPAPSSLPLAGQTQSAMDFEARRHRRAMELEKRRHLAAQKARAASPVRKGASPTKQADASEKEKREVETYLSKPRAVIYVEDGTASVSSKATLRTLDVRFVVLPGMPGHIVKWTSGSRTVGQHPLAAIVDVFSDAEQLVLTVQQTMRGVTVRDTVTFLRPQGASWETAWLEAGLNYLRGA